MQHLHIGYRPDTAQEEPSTYVIGTAETKNIDRVIKGRNFSVQSRNFGVKSRYFGI